MPKDNDNSSSEDDMDNYDNLTPAQSMKKALDSIHVEKIKELLDAKTDPNTVINQYKQTALHVAAGRCVRFRCQRKCSCCTGS